MNRKTFDDWDTASDRINHINNDFKTTSNLQNEFRWLGKLSIFIEDLCQQVNKPNTSIEIGLNITMLSRLWILHAYEIMRTLDENDRCSQKCSNYQKKEFCDTCKKFNTERFFELKKKIEKIRVPLAKLRPQGDRTSTSYVEISNYGSRNIKFTSNEGNELVFSNISNEMFDVVNNYERNHLRVRL